MSKAQPRMKEQDATRVCRFCGKKLDYRGGDESVFIAEAWLLEWGYEGLQNRRQKIR